jgi:hypothetical protein
LWFTWRILVSKRFPIGLTALCQRKKVLTWVKLWWFCLRLSSGWTKQSNALIKVQNACDKHWTDRCTRSMKRSLQRLKGIKKTDSMLVTGKTWQKCFPSGTVGKDRAPSQFREDRRKCANVGSIRHLSQQTALFLRKKFWMCIFSVFHYCCCLWYSSQKAKSVIKSIPVMNGYLSTSLHRGSTSLRRI